MRRHRVASSAVHTKKKGVEVVGVLHGRGKDVGGGVQQAAQFLGRAVLLFAEEIIVVWLPDDSKKSWSKGQKLPHHPP